MVGPKLQADIVGLLLGFRLHHFVLTSDVRQMYRKIFIAPQYRRYHLIRWGFSIVDPVETYQLNTVTYVVSSSPFLAIRTLLELANTGESQFPLAAKAIRSNSYVDIICGEATVDRVLQLLRELIGLFSLGQFELHKWSANHPSLLHNIPKAHRQTQDLSLTVIQNIL